MAGVAMRREHSLQVAVAHMLELVLEPGVTWWSALDHAAQLSPRYGAERKRRGVKRGLPDFIVMAKGMNVIGFELKTEKGRLSPDQVLVQTSWAVMGHDIYTVRSLEEVQEILVLLGVPLRRRMNLFSKGGSHEQRALRSPKARHKRAPRRRKPEGTLPVVQ
jgi:hypothetical protein